MPRVLRWAIGWIFGGESLWPAGEAPECRTWQIEAESRSYQVAVESRSYQVEEESRSYQIEDC